MCISEHLISFTNTKQMNLCHSDTAELNADPVIERHTV